MDTVLAHLKEVRHVEHYCLPALEQSYERWGFRTEIRGVRVESRTDHR